MVRREAPLLVAIGVVIGLPAAWAATHAISSRLYGLKVTDRLTILASTLLVAAASCLATGATAPNFTLHEIGPGVRAAIANAGGKAGAHDGVAVVGTFEDPSAAEELLAANRKTTNLPIKFVLNTHCHLDHVARGWLGRWYHLRESVRVASC